ncbi:hypothetical protein GF377_07580 [candidate division GN15 bacterium]|nr:hypothetical protein [candidate division GN15 bacterium]
MSKTSPTHGYSASLILVLVIALCSVLVTGCDDEGDPPVDPPAAPALSVEDETVVEGATVLFDVSLAEPVEMGVVFTFSTADGTAIAPADYSSTTGEDTIPAGALIATVVVATADDPDVELTETFEFRLTAISEGDITDSVAVGTITDNEVPSARFSSDVRPILQSSCAIVGCHGGGSALGGLGLGDASYESVVTATGANTVFLFPNGRVVQPGDSTSTLYSKTKANPPFGGRMPSNGPPFLTEAQQQRIRDWITDGAINN